MSRRAWAAALMLAGVAAPVVGQDAPLPPAAPTTSAFREPPPAGILGAPIQGEPVDAPSRSTNVIPASSDGLLPPKTVTTAYQPAEVVPPLNRAASLRAPTESPAISASAIERTGRTNAPAADPVNDLLARRASYGKDASTTTTDRTSGKVGEHLDGVLGQRDEWFKSDHCFDGMISPVTNPFLFEDPRSLTELRPIFIYQRIPNGQHDFLGGNTSFFGTQARVAITNRWSFVFNKLGGLWLNPSDSSPIGGQSGFAELWLGPKYTIIRGEQSGSLLAAGLQFQVPVGSTNVFQHTGTLSLVPWVTYGQGFLRDWKYGSFNALASTGYSFSTNNQRNDYWYISGHVDMDLMNWHRVYPLFEMNYFLNTTDARSTPLGVSGRDLINFGSQAKGNGLLTGAFGARFKISEMAQFGGAFEFPMGGNRELFQYRFTLDFILRY